MMFVSPIMLPADMVRHLKKLLVAVAAQQLYLRSASLVIFVCFAIPEVEKRREEGGSGGSAKHINSSEYDIERLLRVVVHEAAQVYVLQTLKGCFVARLAVLDSVGRWVAECEVGEIEEKGLSVAGLRFVKAEVKTDTDKQHSVESEVCSSSPSDGIQQENRKAEETIDGSLGITSDGSAEGVGKDKEQHKRLGNE
ncbi:uncharacterized protein MONOS_2342 [Monocercomonoides exilis]|uniref:uncharacterized protein n=1 Tax=Monocercomonoides exilis TaxID=2049356 RepID=UPI00355A918B|nr:hypothetical protein MONOS_2342 [Monocercomonoides exilis]|eukprot:MONOS_2342.1-p1 / transcript=MONOS_2342.1 / gene=MONOS_2342 / organism=Monocercomonoides_exilis_PA203 / gene_product=unspecified product / transcript_product=unspecified product / location=Mono_scaffold00048:19399-20277(-) / protein_length=196 / sequence_SO=supercontig / SO=protein_coding / is_pseudo=false